MIVPCAVQGGCLRPESGGFSRQKAQSKTQHKAQHKASNRKSEVVKPDDNTRRQRSQPPGPSVSEEFTVTPEDIPEGPVRHGRESFTVQEL